MSTTVKFDYELYQPVRIKGLKDSLYGLERGRIEILAYEKGGPFYRVSHWLTGRKAATWLAPDEIEPIKKEREAKNG